MSFRNRLSLYFAGLVIVPMLAAAVVVILLLAYSDRSRTDARVAEGQTAAIGLYRREVARAAGAAARAGRDPALTGALVTGNAPAARARARQLLASGPARRLRLTRGARVLADVGSANATAPASRRLLGPSGATVGRIEASVITADAYARLVKSITGLETIVRSGGRTLGTSRPGITPGTLPDVGDARIADRDYRVASFDAAAFAGQSVRVSVLSSRAATAPALTGVRVLGAAVALAVFLAVAFGLAMVVSRSLQAQIARFLEGARRLAAGDFSTEVPTQGHDEFAALGAEFNKMSHQLEGRLEELRQERARLEDSIRRIGETFASGLDRVGLLEIVVRTSLDAVNADCGRASVRDHAEAPLRQVAVAGDLGAHGEVLARRGGPGPRRPAGRSPPATTVTARWPTRWRPRTERNRRCSSRGPRRATVHRSASASCSTTSPARRRSRWRTSACTRWSSARRSPTISPGSPTTAASRT